MVAQAVESTTISPAVQSLRRFFTAHGQMLSVEQAEGIHNLVVATLLATLPRECPNWRFDGGYEYTGKDMNQKPTFSRSLDFGIPPGSDRDRALRRLARAWYGRGAAIRHEASILQKDGRARLQAWLDAGAPWAQF